MILETPADDSSTYPGTSATPCDLAAELLARYEISALSALLASTRAALAQQDVSVAVLGRFKAGKSSFLNHFLGRDILPAGVVPVTAAITEVRYGARVRARLEHLDGCDAEIALEEIGAYISEKENPENCKRAARITVELPELRRFRGLRFVDTPGLESALAHNSRTALEWLPNAGLALVAVSVDPPLSERDLDLLKRLYRYTPRVAVLLTKADLVTESQLAEVMEYVRAQLARNLADPPRVFPYSTKPGFERLRQAVEEELMTGVVESLSREREAIVGRKLDTLLRECGEYLGVSLRSAEMADSERAEMGRQFAEMNETAAERKAAIRLAVRDAASRTRQMVSERLEAHEGEVERALVAAFEMEFPRWARSLAVMLASFEGWLAKAFREELAAVSSRERRALLDPLDRVRKQVFRELQQFRDRLSERTLSAFGIPLRTSETEIAVCEPSTPDVRVARIFDRNWELLSPVLPVWMVKGAVRRHFARTIAYLLHQNFSRLAAQWEESINATLWGIENEAGRRLDELMATIGRLIERGSNERASEIRAELARIEHARRSIEAGRGC